MRTVAFSDFGGPEVLRMSELPEPQPGPGELRIRIAAATVNPTDLGFRSGGRPRSSRSWACIRHTFPAWSWPAWWTLPATTCPGAWASV